MSDHVLLNISNKGSYMSAHVSLNSLNRGFY